MNKTLDSAGAVVVVALGGNALLRRNEPPEVDRERRNIKTAATAVARVARQHPVVLTHGNGPQIGELALHEAEATAGASPTPLDVLGAESEGLIGYLLEQELRNALPDVECATLLTQVVVARDDPAFLEPTKPIGARYTQSQAQQLADERGWAVAADGDKWRRVVASPHPRSIVELHAIECLQRAGVLVICVGGGGVPVVIDPDHTLRGVEAVVDKDHGAALLATELRAHALLMLTDAPGVCLDWGTPNAHVVRRAHPDKLSQFTFAPGSMGPKVDAACAFVSSTGGVAGIGAIEDAVAILEGHAGTLVSLDADLELAPLVG
jgi:carbamate kinase